MIDSLTGRVRIIKGSKMKNVPADEVEKYLALGWKRGAKKFTAKQCQKLSKQRKGKVWVTDGVHNHFVHPNDIPMGFVHGRTKK